MEKKMDKLVPIDAELELQDTENRCEGEQREGYQLKGIKFGTIVDNGRVFAVNKAEFDFASSIEILDELSFVEVNGTPPATIAGQMRSQGFMFICDTQIYVENHVKRVLVFGKNI